MIATFFSFIFLIENISVHILIYVGLEPETLHPIERLRELSLCTVCGGGRGHFTKMEPPIRVEVLAGARCSGHRGDDSTAGCEREEKQHSTAKHFRFYFETKHSGTLVNRT